MIFPAAKYEEYCSVVRITSKEFDHPVPLIPWQTQLYLRREIQRALNDDIHECVILKGVRQAGGSTECWVLAGFWHQRYALTQGAIVAESSENEMYARDVIREVIGSAPAEYRRAVLVDNPVMLRFDNRSRLMFMHAAEKAGVKGKLGRSRGLNFLAATEVGSWTDDVGIGSLRAALSKEHKRRVILWESTARGHGPWYDMCRTAMKATAQRFIFLGWWLRDGYEINPETQVPLWRAYGSMPPNAEEARLMHEVQTRYGVTVRQTQLAWWRWQYRESFNSDDALMNQEFGWLPEDCFQSFGKKFIGAAVLRQVRADVEAAPEVTGYRLNWGRTFDQNGDDTIVPAPLEEEPPLLVWEEPDPGGVYVVGAHPAYSSSPEESDYVCEVFRAWPDRLEQVAEYFAPGDEGAMFSFTWTILALCSIYANAPGPYLIIDVSSTGTAVLEEAQQLQQHGWGLSTQFREKNPRVLNFLGNVRQFLYHRPDSFSRTVALQWKGAPSLRPWLLNQYRDTLERCAMVVRSSGLMEELAALRQGEDASDDQIGGSGRSRAGRVMASALVSKMWRENAVPELTPRMMPKAPDPHAPKNANEMVIQGFFGNLLARYGG